MKLTFFAVSALHSRIVAWLGAIFRKVPHLVTVATLGICWVFWLLAFATLVAFLAAVTASAFGAILRHMVFVATVVAGARRTSLAVWAVPGEMTH